MTFGIWAVRWQCDGAMIKLSAITNRRVAFLSALVCRMIRYLLRAAFLRRPAYNIVEKELRGRTDFLYYFVAVYFFGMRFPQSVTETDGMYVC